MKREIGTSAGFVALLAVIFHAAFPSGSESGSAGPGGAPSSHRAPKSADQSAATQPPEGPWIATQAFFGVPGSLAPPHGPGDDPAVGFQSLMAIIKKLVAPEATKQDDLDDKAVHTLMGVPDGGWEILSVIATVADPFHTRLPLLLDGQIEAIENSAQAAHWEFAGQWLPWLDRFDAEEGDIPARRQQRWLQREQEQLPGVLVFRAAPDRHAGGCSTPNSGTPVNPVCFPRKALLIFIVPETPTGGIADPPFNAAMHLASGLSSTQIGLLGPTFSGSFYSLTRLVNNWQSSKAGKAHPFSRTVYGGTISSVAHARAFQGETGLNFRGGIANGDDYHDVFCAVLKRYGINPSDAAYLSESETAYGNIYEEKGPELSRISRPCQIHTYNFPRDIAHLRNTYREGPGRGQTQNPQAQPTINFSIKDPNSGEDSIPVFSDSQTPLAQNAVIGSITGELRRKRVRLVYLAATNVLDTLFLANFLRHEIPDARIITEDANILFVPAASRASLAGTLLLSAYPMSLFGNQWLMRDEHEKHIMFASPWLQGIFNVTQFLLTDLKAQRVPDLQAYRQFDRDHPGLWLLTLTRSGFFPIDLFDENHDGRQHHISHNLWFVPQVLTSPIVLREDDPPLEWLITMIVVTAFTITGSFLLVASNSLPGAKLWWLALDGDFRANLPSMIGGCLALSGLELVLALPVWCTPAQPTFTARAAAAGAFAGFLAPMLSLALTLYVLYWRHPQPGPPSAESPRQAAVFSYGALSVVLLAALLAGWYIACYKQPLDAAFFFRFRALHLYSGSSPALPFVLLSLILFVFSLFYFGRYKRSGAEHPRLSFGVDTIDCADQNAQIKDWLERLHCTYQGLNHEIMAPLSLDVREWQQRFWIAGVLTGICWLILASYPRAFETPSYSYVLYMAISFVLFCLASGCYDLLRIWKNLKELLDMIEPFPLKRSLDRITQDWPHRPIWVFRQPGSRQFLKAALYRAFKRRQSVLLELERQGLREAVPTEPEAAMDPGPANAVSTAEQAASAKFAETDRRSLAEAYNDPRKYEEVAARLAARTLTKDLIPAWRQNVDDDEHADHGGDHGSEPGPDHVPNPQQEFVDRCCDFFTLQVCRYIVYVVWQIQRIAWSISCGFLMLIVFFNSYVPQGPMVIARFLATVFVALGFVIVRVFGRMERNDILSRISHTTPGELNPQFWVQLAALGGLPLIGVLAHLFPQMSEFLFSWVAPGIQELR